jgi:hypothetical protein
MMPTVRRFGHVRRSERDARTLQPEEEVRVASKAIELRDDQRRFAHAACG